jgi:hypothetical protein
MPEWITKITKPELRGLAEARRWESPEMLVESFQNLEKLRGIPADKILAIPETTDQASLDLMYNRLGRPEKPEAYAFPKDVEGSDTNKWMAETLHKLGLSAHQAKALFDANAARTAGIQQKAIDKAKVEATNSMANLKNEWGAAYDANMAMADRALVQFGMTDKTIKPLTEMVGGAAVVKFLQAVGKSLGEGTFIAGDGVRNPNAPMTPAEAKATIKEKMKDKGFTERLVAKDAVTVAEWERLNKYAAPQTA